MIFKIQRVQEETGLGRSSVFSYVEKGLLTRQIKCGARSAGWPDYEILEINRARIAGKSDDEIRQLVASLHEARKGLDRGVQS